MPQTLSSTPRPAFIRALRTLVILLSIGLPALFVLSAMHRLRSPYELEELEGNMVRTVERVAADQPIYVAPNIHFVPYMYPPGYYYASVIASKVAHPGFFALRLVSVLSTLAAFGLIALIVRRETGSWLYGAAAAALYAGCYPLSGNWYDLARLDALLILLLLAALYCTRWHHPVLAAVVWLLAFQTKQSILPAAVIILCSRFREWKKTVAALAVFLIGAALSVWWLNHVTGGWYSYYVFRVPSANSDLLVRPLVTFIPSLLLPLGIAIVVIAASVLVRTPSWQATATRFYVAAFSFVLFAWFVMMHAGSTGNVYMPACMSIAIVFGVAVHRLMQADQPVVRAIVLGAVAAQLAALIYNPGDFAPVAEHKRSAEASLTLARSLGGAVYMPRHTYYGQLAGAPELADIVAFQDAVRAQPPAEQQRLRGDLQAAIDAPNMRGIFFETSDDVASFARRDTMGTEWIAHYAVRTPLPGATSQSHPAWYLLRCAAPQLAANLPTSAAPQPAACPEAAPASK